MQTKPQRYVQLMRDAKFKEDEAYYLRREAHEVRRAMGNPDPEQIEVAANEGKEIVRGCTQDR